MIQDSFTLRRAAVAYMFPGKPQLTRDDNLKFYDTVTRQGVDVPQFTQKDTSVQLARLRPGTPPGAFLVEAGEHQGRMRFLVAEEWPSTRTLELTGKDADIGWDSFREVWPPKRVGGKPVLVEVNLRSTAAVRGGSATEFLRDHCLHLTQASLKQLAREVSGLGLKIVLPVQVSTGGDEIPLNGAAGEIRVETLLDDPTRLYIEATFNWPAIPIPEEVREQIGGPNRINAEVLRPSEYLRNADDYLKGQLTSFLLALGER